MYHLIYLSSATRLFTQTELRELLRESRQRNEEEGITGVLVYKDGSFLQAIEGEKESVLALYQRISKDSRHRGLLIVFSEEIPQRDFPHWTMAFYDASPSSDVSAGFNDLLNQSSPGEQLSVYPAKVRAFLKSLVRQ